MNVRITRSALAALCLTAMLAAPALVRAEPLDEALEKQTRVALEKIGPSVVAIQTSGGLEVIKPGLRKGDGNSTGVVVETEGKDCYIISSSFNFAHLPKDKAAVFVRFQGDKDIHNAVIVATDETRMLTLIKIPKQDAVKPDKVEKKDVKIGQWAIAVGRAWSGVDNPSPSPSVGIISAANRIWGRAFQTDCKTSPTNYGGPLMDMEGRVIGIIVPMSPQGADATAGYEWYDGGIGFAVSMDDVYRVLPELKKGKNIKQGILGVTFKDAQDFSAPVIGSIAPNSPAANAKSGEEKLQPGDKILEVGSYDANNKKEFKKVNNLAQVKHQIFNKYAGDKIALMIDRAGKTLEFADIVMAEQSPSKPLPFLGILPMRDDDQPGVEVRHVFAKSGAAEAKIAVGDRILKVDGAAVAHRDALLAKLSTLTPGQTIKIDLKRKDGKEENVSVKLGDLSDEVGVSVPAELPKGSLEKAKGEAKEVKKGLFSVKTDEATGHEYWAFVPENYDPKKTYTLMVWLHPANDDMQKLMTALWTDKEAFCQKHDIILLAPKSLGDEWGTKDIEPVKADIRDMVKNYSIDKQRVVVHGQGIGASFGFYLAFDSRDLIRGVAAIGGVMRTDPKPIVANQRVAFFLVAGAKDPNFVGVTNNKNKLGIHKYPTIYHEIPDHGNGYPDPKQQMDLIRQLARWIDCIDRL